LPFETIIKGNQNVPSSIQTSALVMDIVPLLMRLMRNKFREKRMGELSMAQFRTLAFIDGNPGASLSEVASHIGLGLPSMSKLIDRLVTRNLITRDMHAQDRRRICLALTRLGRRELDEAYRHAQTFFAGKFSRLSEGERTRVADALRLLRTLFALNAAEPNEVSAQPQ
jgi:DNA-binding MarR family transcriptional regulator